LSVTPGVTQNFIKRPKLVLDGYIGLEIKDSKATTENRKTSFDRLRILKAGPRLNLQDSQGRTSIVGDIHYGLHNFLGSSDDTDANASRSNAGGEFMYYTLSASRIQRLSKTSYLALRTSGQWSPDNLPSPEQFRAGGMYSVRGYPESDAIGDRGFNASAEINFPTPFLPKGWKVPLTDERLQDSLRWVAFIDGARTSRRKRATVTEKKEKYLVGTGVGIRIKLAKSISFRFDYALPIGDESGDKDRKRWSHIALTFGQ